MAKELDFDIESLAKYLHLTPNQVRKMANRGKLPGRRINNQWRFSKPEIHLWFEDKIGISDDAELKHVEQVLNDYAQRSQDPDVSLSDLIPVELIQVPLSAKTKSRVIESICEVPFRIGRLWEPDKMRDAIRAREQLHPTALENGVAFLHPRRPMPGIIDDTFVALGITPSGVPFGGPRGVLTDIYFLLGSATEQIHLRILARLSRLVGQSELLSKMRECTSAEQIKTLITEAENELT